MRNGKSIEVVEVRVRLGVRHVGQELDLEVNDSAERSHGRSEFLLEVFVN